MSTRDDLITAKALIDAPEKWCRYVAWNTAGARCTMGACNVVSQGRNERLAFLESALQRCLPKTSSFISDFNDDQSTTHADIMALFDRAIASEPTP